MCLHRERDRAKVTRSKLKEITLTAEYAWLRGIVTRLEYRHDWSNQPYFDQATQLPLSNHSGHAQAIALLAFSPELRRYVES